jgi:hypothetical protein
MALAAQRTRRDYKLEHGCVSCGFQAHHAALHFDHVEGKKEINISTAKSIEQAKQEIAKCVVRCANCHSIRHFEERQAQPPQISV